MTQKTLSESFIYDKHKHLGVCTGDERYIFSTKVSTSVSIRQDIYRVCAGRKYLWVCTSIFRVK